MSFKKKFYYYSFFCLLYLLTITLSVSLISFFHFYLGHPIEVVQEWVFDNGWGIIIVGKVFSLILLYKFYNLKRGLRYSVKELFFNNFKAANRETLLILLFFLGLGLLLGLKENDSYVLDVYKIAISYFFGLLFYLIDIFILVLLGKNNHQDELPNGFSNLIFAFMFVITSMVSFLLITINSTSEKPNLTVTFFNMVILLFLTNLNKAKSPNLTNPLLFLTFFICPMMSFFGWDPIWAKTYSFFEGGALFDSKTYLAVCLFILYYMNLKNLKIFKNIFKKEK